MPRSTSTAFLEASPTGKLSIGIGMGAVHGTVSLPRAELISSRRRARRAPSTVTMEFQMTPSAPETPRRDEHVVPRLPGAVGCENCTATLHNLYTLRGAEGSRQQRLGELPHEMLARYGSEAQVTFQAQNWRIGARTSYATIS